MYLKTKFVCVCVGGGGGSVMSNSFCHTQTWPGKDNAEKKRKKTCISVCMCWVGWSGVCYFGEKIVKGLLRSCCEAYPLECWYNCLYPCYSQSQVVGHSNSKWQGCALAIFEVGVFQVKCRPTLAKVGNYSVYAWNKHAVIWYVICQEGEIVVGNWEIRVTGCNIATKGHCEWK